MKAKLIKYYEEYINSVSNKISILLQNMINMFKDTFEGKNNILSVEETALLSLIEIEKSNTNDIQEQNLIINFSDTEFYYQVIFIIKYEDVKDNIKNGYLKIKIYDYNNKLINEYQSNLDLKIPDDDEKIKNGRFFVKVKKSDDKGKEYDYIENFIISLVGELKYIKK